MEKINRVVIHHSASSDKTGNPAWGSALEIDKWHKEFGWTGIGYHFSILNGYTNAEDAREGRIWKPLIGQVEVGRRLDLDRWIEANEQGAHVLGYNKDSIGICLIHDDGLEYDQKMFRSLFYLCKFLMKTFPTLYPPCFLGHYELDPINKAKCPGFDMNWFRDLLKNKERWNFWDVFC